MQARTRRKKEGNRAFLFLRRRPTRFNYSYSFIQNFVNEIPVGASAKESVLAAYVSIGNEAKQLQNSQLNGNGKCKTCPALGPLLVLLLVQLLLAGDYGSSLSLSSTLTLSLSLPERVINLSEI